MKHYSNYGLTGAMCLLLVSCTTYKVKQETAILTFPELGSIVKAKGSILFSAAEQVGKPNWNNALKVDVQELPFNKRSYGKYAKYISHAGKINSISYVDSLPYKPKHLRLQLLDKIELTSLLNNEGNMEVLHYVMNNEDYKLVTQIDITLQESIMPSFLQAEAILLKKDKFNNGILILVNDTHEQQYYFSELQIFDYQYATFCWGEDRYHNKKIRTIISEGEKCPKGTYTNPAKVNGDKSYLKF